MSDSPIQYRLIKKEKHTGARLGEIITPHHLSNTYVYAGRHSVTEAEEDMPFGKNVHEAFSYMIKKAEQKNFTRPAPCAGASELSRFLRTGGIRRPW